MRLKPDAIPTKFIFSAEKPRRKIPYDRHATTTTTTTKKSSGTARCLNVSMDTTVDINVIDKQLKSIENTDPIVSKDSLESTESGRPLLVTAAVVLVVLLTCLHAKCCHFLRKSSSHPFLM